MKKITILMLVLFATVGLQACNSSNGDRAKGGESDTVGTKTSGGYEKDSASSAQDTLKH